MPMVFLFSGSIAVTKEDKDQVCIVGEKLVAVSSHITENSQNINKTKMIQTLTSRIK